MFQEKYIVGKRFGRLIATRKLKPHKNGGKWEFDCDCGKKYQSRPSPVIGGTVISCGCYKQEVRHSQKKEKAPRWKGGEAKDESILAWINRNYPEKPKRCNFCGRSSSSRTCLKKPYTRDIKDYVGICPSCIKRGVNFITFQK